MDSNDSESRFAVSAPVLSVNDVSVKFGDLSALRDVSIEIPRGKTIGLIGPNGAGKIAGRQVATHGRIEFEGVDVTHDSADHRARNGMRRTFQELGLFVEMTVLDNLLVARDTANIEGGRGDARQSRTAVMELVDSLGLGAWLDHQVQTLPHPVQRLVSYARAIAGEPRLLLLDEPSAGLSDSARAILASQIRHDISSRKMTVVLVEHDMGFIKELCDQAYVLNAGQVIAFGTFGEIAANESVKSAYLGEEVRA